LSREAEKEISELSVFSSLVPSRLLYLLYGRQSEITNIKGKKAAGSAQNTIAPPPFDAYIGDTTFTEKP
jgi:hypothetical protein